MVPTLYAPPSQLIVEVVSSCIVFPYGVMLSQNNYIECDRWIKTLGAKTSSSRSNSHVLYADTVEL